MEYAGFLAGVGIALALGGLIGLEREKLKQPLVGVRSFALLSVFGFIVFYSVGLAGALVGLAGGLLLASFYYKAKSQNERASYGVTTALMIPFTYVLGVLVGIGKGFEASTAAVVATALLVEKSKVHEIASGITKRELVDLLIFAIIAFIVYPILPQGDVTVEGVKVSPTFFWSIVVVVNGIGLAGHAAAKYFKAKGVELVIFFSGMVSALATMAVFSRENKSKESLNFIFSIAFIGAIVGDVALLAVVSKPMLFEVAPLLASVLAGCVAIACFNLKNDNQIVAGKKELSLGFAVEFAIVLLIVTLFLSPSNWGAWGWLTAFIGGIISSTSVIATAAYSFNPANAAAAAWSVFFAILGSTLAKSAVVYARVKNVKDLVIPTAVITACGLVGIYLTIIF